MYMIYYLELEWVSLLDQLRGHLCKFSLLLVVDVLLMCLTKYCGQIQPEGEGVHKKGTIGVDNVVKTEKYSIYRIMGNP